MKLRTMLFATHGTVASILAVARTRRRVVSCLQPAANEERRGIAWGAGCGRAHCVVQ